MNPSSALSFHQIPQVAAETLLLEHFAKEPGAFIIQKENVCSGKKYFFAQAQVEDMAGFGRGLNKRTALVKAVAEFYERKFMQEAFDQELSHVPKVLQTSNGFAVHFSQNLSAISAMTEAVERHLLQYTFFKDGWNGFELIREETVGDEQLSFVVSKYSINGMKAGMVIATSKRFQGASFGYFADRSDNMESSEKWNHAIFEATDKIEPFLKISQAWDLPPIDKGIWKWMNTPFNKIQFKKNNSETQLSDVSLKIRSFDLSDRWGLPFPLFASFCDSPDFLPLIVTDRISVSDTTTISGLLTKFGLSNKIPERNPIL